MTTTLDRPTSISPPSNGDVLVAAGAGNRALWEELVHRYTGMLWSLARSFRLDEDDSADVVQSTWLRLVENIHRLSDPDSVCGWLADTAHQECLQLLRFRRREAVVAAADHDVVSDGPGPDERVIARDGAEQVRAALDRLPEEDAVLLRLLMDGPAPSHDDVAAVLDVPVASIGPARARALARLRVALTADDLASLA